MSGSGIHVACVGLVFWLLVHREDESQDHKAVTKDNCAHGLTMPAGSTLISIPAGVIDMSVWRVCLEVALEVPNRGG